MKLRANEVHNLNCNSLKLITTIMLSSRTAFMHAGINSKLMDHLERTEIGQGLFFDEETHKDLSGVIAASINEVDLPRFEEMQTTCAETENKLLRDGRGRMSRLTRLMHENRRIARDLKSVEKIIINWNRVVSPISVGADHIHDVENVMFFHYPPSKWMEATHPTKGGQLAPKKDDVTSSYGGVNSRTFENLFFGIQSMAPLCSDTSDVSLTFLTGTVLIDVALFYNDGWLDEGKELFSNSNTPTTRIPDAGIYGVKAFKKAAKKYIISCLKWLDEMTQNKEKKFYCMAYGAPAYKVRVFFYIYIYIIYILFFFFFFFHGFFLHNIFIFFIFFFFFYIFFLHFFIFQIFF